MIEVQSTRDHIQIQGIELYYPFHRYAWPLLNAYHPIVSICAIEYVSISAVIEERKRKKEKTSVKKVKLNRKKTK